MGMTITLAATITAEWERDRRNPHRCTLTFGPYNASVERLVAVDEMPFWSYDVKGCVRHGTVGYGSLSCKSEADAQRKAEETIAEWVAALNEVAG